MPTPTFWAQPSPNPRDDFASLLQNLAGLEDGVNAFGTQGDVCPMVPTLQTPLITSLAGAPSFTGEEKAEVDALIPCFDPRTDHVTYPGESHIEDSWAGANHPVSFDADLYADFASHQDLECYTTAITWDDAPSSVAPTLAASTDLEPGAAPNTHVISWSDILGSSAPAFLQGNTNAPVFGSETDCDVDQHLDGEEGCSRHCDFFPWRQRWFAVHCLLQGELEDPARQPSPTVDIMYDAFDDLTRDLGQLECDCAYVVTEAIDEMTILRIVLRSSKSNMATLARLLCDRLDRLNEEIQVAACAFRHSDDGSNTDKSSTTFISSHAGSVYLDV